ncbi:endonuclease/exonuclease/phosphatase family protein [Glycomyces tenuis]|uniref:endonuclease/exonuclease/phosphatase family protein n=1 Tax=Glycomyces tenuis TaxID=58116 RepID=UPI00042A8B0A|nr:endonuclease/exonuclease/phosphatase family protein [Glycomyces tenuis]
MTVNIGAAASERAVRIGQWLAEADDDVAVLTETSAGPGTAMLLDRHRRAGWNCTNITGPVGDRGAAIISRLVPGEAIPPPMSVTLPHRLASHTIGTEPSAIVLGVYVPSRDRSQAKVERKQAFLEALLTAIESYDLEVRERLLLAGDFNVVAADSPQARTMMPFELEVLPRLAETGLVDLAAAADFADEPTWVGRTGDRYRYDYVFAGTAIAECVAGVEFLHETRTLGLTDHSAVRVRFKCEADRLAVAGPVPESAPTLF